MKKIRLLILVSILMLLSAGVFAENNYVPLNYPDLNTAFKVPAWKTWTSPSTPNYSSFLQVPAWKTWTSPSGNDDPDSLKVPAWKSWKPLSFSSWDLAFNIPWR